ncbi:helix-turn-helix domain-containing protein [Thalassiella azotivora]
MHSHDDGRASPGGTADRAAPPGGHGHQQHCRTLVPGDDLDGVLEDIRHALDRGLSVTVTSHAATLTTQEAADVLGVSRPTLVRLLEQGRIPYDQPGRHRRVHLADVLAFQRQCHHGDGDDDPGAS